MKTFSYTVHEDDYYFFETINSCHREVNSNCKESPVAKGEEYTRNITNL